MEKYALFIYESLKKTKCREFVPSRDEIEALIHRQEMTSTVYCHGGGSCKITINSHTTAGEVGSVSSPGVLGAHLPVRLSTCGPRGEHNHAGVLCSAYLHNRPGSRQSQPPAASVQIEVKVQLHV